MGWFKQAMGLEAPKSSMKQADMPGAAEMPFGLALGRMICFKKDLRLLLTGETDVVVPDDDKIMAIGTIDAGQGIRLVRCYLDNEDYFIQFVMSGPRADDIADIILFGYHEVKTLASKAELLRMIGPQSKIGMPFYELEGAEYSRQWGTEDGQTEMTPLTEKVVTLESSYSVYHDCVLYARDLALTNRREFLFLSAETDEAGNIALSTTVGVTLQITDISVL
jgi:hypothetical protein